uniref:Uncharacterized protein n=1 Tax=Manihot esculenta TaxID=3983 RepID=A0A2C9W149_MANES
MVSTGEGQGFSLSFVFPLCQCHPSCLMLQGHLDAVRFEHLMYVGNVLSVLVHVGIEACLRSFTHVSACVLFPRCCFSCISAVRWKR